MKQFSEEELKYRACRRVAVILFEQWEEFGGGDTRLFDWLIDDKFTYVGSSINGNEYREHLVPRALLRDICIQLFNAGKSIDDATQIIINNLKIARITTAEAKKIDNEIGLRTTMPDGWHHENGDFMARLNAAGIILNEKK